MGFDNLNSHMDLTGGYEGKFFLGKVVENVDPLNISRIKASVQGLYDPDSGDIPWAGPVKFSPFGCGPAWGPYGSPEIGSDVLILLQDGDAHYPVYWSVQMFANASFPSGTSWGFQDPYGNFFRMDAAKTVKVETASGVKINIDGEGNVSINVPGNSKTTVGKDYKLNVTGDCAIGVEGDCKVTVGGACKVTAPTTELESEVTVTGNTTMNGNLLLNGNFDSSGNMTNNGTNVGNSHTHSDPQGGSTGPAQ